MKKAPWEHVAGTAAIAMHQDPTWQAQEIADGRGNANNLKCWKLVLCIRSNRHHVSTRWCSLCLPEWNGCILARSVETQKQPVGPAQSSSWSGILIPHDQTNRSSSTFFLQVVHPKLPQVVAPMGVPPLAEPQDRCWWDGRTNIFSMGWGNFDESKRKALLCQKFRSR